MKKKTTIKALENQFNLYMLLNMGLAIVMIILGLILYINPSIAIKTASWIIGIFFIIQGVALIYSYIKSNINLMSLNMAMGIIVILLGIFILSNPFAIINVLNIGLGIWLIVSGAYKINFAIQLKKVKESSWLITLVVGIISIIFALMVIFNPFAKLVLVQVIGLFMIVYAIIDLTDSLLLKNRAKQFIKLFK